MLSDRVRTAVQVGEIAGSSDLFREDAGFRSPVVYRPYAGRDAVLKVLEATERVLGLGGHFRHVLQLEDSDARVAILGFATVVDGRQSRASTRSPSTRTDASQSLKVMLRPAPALQAVGARLAEEFARLRLATSA